MVNKDEIKGKLTEIKGKITNDKSEELKGKAQQEYGKIREQVEEGADVAAKKGDDLVDDCKKEDKK